HDGIAPPSDLLLHPEEFRRLASPAPRRDRSRHAGAAGPDAERRSPRIELRSNGPGRPHGTARDDRRIGSDAPARMDALSHPHRDFLVLDGRRVARHLRDRLLVTAGMSVEAGIPRGWHELAHAWELDPLVVGGLLVLGALYARGVMRGRRLRRGVRHREVLFF